MYYALDDFAEPSVFVLQDQDRFFAIRHSGEIRRIDKTTMVLVIFVVCRTSGLFDLFIVNKFFRPDGSTNRTFMSKKDVRPAEIEKTLTVTSSTFAQSLRSAKGPVIQWDQLDLRVVENRGEQIRRIKKWGKLRSVRVKAD